MAINLPRGGVVSLSKEEPNLKRVIVGLGWQAREADGVVFDLDSSAFLLRADGKVRSDSDFIFYNNLMSEDGAVEHTGDNRTGIGAGDDERLAIDLARMAPDIDKVVVAVTVHDAEQRGQTFGMVGQAFIRCVNADNDREIARYDLSEDRSSETAVIFGELYRAGPEWKFRAVGQGYRGGLVPLARSYGVDA